MTDLARFRFDTTTSPASIESEEPPDGLENATRKSCSNTASPASERSKRSTTSVRSKLLGPIQSTRHETSDCIKNDRDEADCTPPSRCAEQPLVFTYSDVEVKPLSSVHGPLPHGFVCSLRSVQHRQPCLQPWVESGHVASRSASAWIPSASVPTPALWSARQRISEVGADLLMQLREVFSVQLTVLLAESSSLAALWLGSTN